MEVTLLAPGPSMSQALADSLRGGVVGVVNNCFKLAPWAHFMVAQDIEWWQKHPEAMRFAGRKFTANEISGVERVPGGATSWNSGLMALQTAVWIGATRVLLYGFDMRGSHFFGKYENGLANTNDRRRGVHLRQFEAWASRNKDVEVINCTPGSAITCFQTGGGCRAA